MKTTSATRYSRLAFALLGAFFLPRSADAAAQAEDPHRAIEAAHVITADIDGNARGIATLLSKARRTSDKRAIACVNESLSEADAISRRARDRSAEIREEIQRGDAVSEQRAARALGLMQRDREIARAISREAFACVGVALHRNGEAGVTTVRVIIDKDIAPEI